VILLSAIGAMAAGLLLWGGGGELPAWPPGRTWSFAWIPALVVCVAAVLTVVLPGRIQKVVVMAVVGYGMAVFYVMFRAPDLALTQLLVETVSLLLILLIFRRIPRPDPPPRPPAQRLAHLGGGRRHRRRDGAAGLDGRLLRGAGPRGPEQLALSLPEAKGANVVNVILVDFRGVDTLGEAVVLVIAMLGAVALFDTGRRRGRGGRRVRPPRPAGPACAR
jgi:multicomponent K+:H+ antiporter subunit A